MKSLTWIGWITAVLSIASCMGMFFAFDEGLYSLGFIMIYGFISFFTISVIVFKIKRQTEVKEKQ